MTYIASCVQQSPMATMMIHIKLLSTHLQLSKSVLGHKIQTFAESVKKNLDRISVLVSGENGETFNLVLS